MNKDSLQQLCRVFLETEKPLFTREYTKILIRLDDDTRQEIGAHLFLLFCLIMCIVCMSVCIIKTGLLAEDKGKVVFGLLLVPKVFETQSFQEAQQALIVYGKLSP